jgi:hypothetical protein
MPTVTTKFLVGNQRRPQTLTKSSIREIKNVRFFGQRTAGNIHLLGCLLLILSLMFAGGWCGYYARMAMK